MPVGTEDPRPDDGDAISLWYLMSSAFRPDDGALMNV
jgi:hypothetical protein